MPAERLGSSDAALAKYDGRTLTIDGKRQPDGLLVKEMLARCAKDPDLAADADLNRALLNMIGDGRLNTATVGYRLRGARDRPIEVDTGAGIWVARLVAVRPGQPGAKSKKPSRWKVEHVNGDMAT